MAKFKKYEIGENEPILIDVGTILPKEHLSRQLEQIVSELDTSSIESTFSELGQSAIHPKLLLCVIFYGYITGTRSGRKLEKSCKENLAYIYLCRNNPPSKSVLNDFRKDFFKEFTGLFLQIITKCQELGLGDPSLSIVDGSKFRANSAKWRNKTKAGFEKWLARLQADIADLESELAAKEEQDLEKKKLKAKRKLSKKIETAITDLEGQSAESRLNLTDGDSLVMKGKKGNFDTYYNVQAACSEDQIISFCDVVVDHNDRQQLVPALKGIVENTGKSVNQVLADGDYGSFDAYEYMIQTDVEAYVPYVWMNTTFEDKPYHASNFKYDKQNDKYICPTGRQLSFYRMSQDKDRQQNFKCYRTDACLNCPFQEICCPKKVKRRVIKREVRQGLKDQMKERLNSPQGKEMYRRRLHPIEAIFGHFKFNLGYTHFLLRGLEKVKAEFCLMCLTHNLRRLIAKLSNFWLFGLFFTPYDRKKWSIRRFPRFVKELGQNTLIKNIISLRYDYFLLSVLCFSFSVSLLRT